MSPLITLAPPRALDRTIWESPHVRLGGLSPARVAATAVRHGSHPNDALAAATNLVTGKVQLLAVSGKLAGGKDTVAPLVLDLYAADERAQQSFAFALKNEVDDIFNDIRTWVSDVNLSRSSGVPLGRRDRDALASYLAGRHNMPFAQALEYFTGDVATEVITNPAIHSRSRTAAIRFALQVHGTNVRRAQQDMYWVSRTVTPAVAELASGASVYFTDARFPNEVDAVRALGGMAIRVDVSPAVQRARLFDRDGLEPDPELLAHRSEVALDHYESFDVRVPNDGPIGETLNAIAADLAASGRL